MLLLAAVLLAFLCPIAHGDDGTLVRNADFKDGSQGWHGDGHVVYVKPDGTEGSEDDPDVVPAMKIALERYQAHAVYQELNTKPVLARVQVSAQVFASDDFKRIGTSDSVAVDAPMVTTSDFLIQLNPDYLQNGSALTPGHWTTINTSFELLHAADERGIYLMVPPGKGFIYIKNLSITP